MTYSGNSVPERPFRAYLASGRSRHVETAKKALENNTVRLDLPKLGERGYFFSSFFCRYVLSKMAFMPETLNYLKLVWNMLWRAHQV